MRSRDELPHDDAKRTATLEQLRNRRRTLASHIQSLLSQLESAEREFEGVNKELEQLAGKRR
jgi:chaperonin cofactor prefoldin